VRKRRLLFGSTRTKPHRWGNRSRSSWSVEGCRRKWERRSTGCCDLVVAGHRRRVTHAPRRPAVIKCGQCHRRGIRLNDAHLHVGLGIIKEHRGVGREAAMLKELQSWDRWSSGPRLCPPKPRTPPRTPELGRKAISFNPDVRPNLKERTVKLNRSDDTACRSRSGCRGAASLSHSGCLQQAGRGESGVLIFGD